MNDVETPPLFDPSALEAPGQARHVDPWTSKEAARLIKAKASSARIVLLQAHHRFPEGMIDEQAARRAGLPLTSEYATRCSELVRIGALEDTGRTEAGASGAKRMVRQITAMGEAILLERETFE